MKVADLSGRELDWHVAKALGFRMVDVPPDIDGENTGQVLAPPLLLESGYTFPNSGALGRYAFIPHYSTSWLHGGPLIERERINLFFEFDENHPQVWHAMSDEKPRIKAATAAGETPLIAAMRAFVSSKFGDEVPDVKGQ